MDIICESCGVANQAGTEFCLFCGTYLAWDRSVLVPPREPGAAAPPGAPPHAAAAVGVHGSTPRATPLPEPLPAAQPPPEPAPPEPAPPGSTLLDAAQPPGVDAGTGCPACGRLNESGLRFCAKCGQVLGSAASRPTSPPASRALLLRSRDRAARLAYRRSLPPLYRWRRVLIGVLVAVLGLGGLVAVGRHPVRWAVDRYDDLRNTTVIVPKVQAGVDPPEATAGDTTPAALTDVNEAAWTMTWRPTEQGASCGGAPGTGVVVLTIAPRRIRQIDLRAGLSDTSPDRLRQHRPESIGVSFDDGPCRSFPLEDTADPQHLAVDSAVEVSVIRIGVDTAYAPAEGGQPLLSFTEIFLHARPVR